MSGKLVRLSRISRADGRAVVIALDHGQFKHEAKGRTLAPDGREVITGHSSAVRHSVAKMARVGRVLTARSVLHQEVQL